MRRLSETILARMGNSVRNYVSPVDDAAKYSKASKTNKNYREYSRSLHEASSSESVLLRLSKSERKSRQ